MSGGIAYVLDMSAEFRLRCNLAMVSLQAVLPEAQQAAEGHHQGQSDEALLQALLSRHLAATGSELARNILADWPRYRTCFVKVLPHEYARILSVRAAQDAAAA